MKKGHEEAEQAREDMVSTHVEQEDTREKSIL